MAVIGSNMEKMDKFSNYSQLGCMQEIFWLKFQCHFILCFKNVRYKTNLKIADFQRKYFLYTPEWKVFSHKRSPLISLQVVLLVYIKSEQQKNGGRLKADCNSNMSSQSDKYYLLVYGWQLFTVQLLKPGHLEDS